MVNLTIVARRPDCKLPLDDINPLSESNGEDNGPIDELMTKLRARSNQQNHLVRRASTIQHIREIMESMNSSSDGLDIIQIVGHGRVGSVELGDFWFHKSQEPQIKPTGTQAIYTLDSDLNRIGILKASIKAPARVRLLACLAGKPGSPPEAIEDGPTLLFTLAQMWRTEVTAPCETFNADAFDTEGMFTLSETLVRVADLDVTIPPRSSTAKFSMATSGSKPENIEFKRFVSAPRFARMPDESTLREDLLRTLTNETFSPIEFRESFSSAEMIFDCTRGDLPWKCEVIADGTMLRMRSASQTVHMVPGDSALAKLRAMMTRLSDVTYSL